MGLVCWPTLKAAWWALGRIRTKNGSSHHDFILTSLLATTWCTAELYDRTWRCQLDYTDWLRYQGSVVRLRRVLKQTPPSVSFVKYKHDRSLKQEILRYNKKLVGVWRSLVAHLVWDQGVQGSNPCTPTKKYTKSSLWWAFCTSRLCKAYLTYLPVAQLDRASAF